MGEVSVRRTIIIGLDEIVPPSALNVLFVPPVPDGVVAVLAKRPGARTTVAAIDSPEAAAAGPFDGVFFYEPGQAAGCAAACASMLEPDGFLVLPVPMAGGVETRESVCESELLDAGLYLYIAYENSLAAEAGYRFVSRGTVFGRIGAWVRKGYDPFRHAMRARDLGRPDWAYEILKMVPFGGISDPAGMATVTLEKQRYLEEQFDAGDTCKRLSLLWAAQEEAHYLPARAFPFLAEVYARQALMWGKLGVCGHAGKMLRDLWQAVPDARLPEPVAAQLAGLDVTVMPAAPVESAPDWRPTEPRPRVLMITPLFPNYGLDVLYDGLCAVLGDGQVDDFPWKPWLHGETPDIAQNYPCMCDRPGAPLDNHTLITRIVDGYYRYVLVPDVETCAQFLPPDLVRVILQAAARALDGTSVYLVDQADDFTDHSEYVRKELEFALIRGCFKRELIAGVDCGSNVFPCPFGYHDWRVPPRIDAARGQDVFWAGNRNAFRSVYVEAIERLLDRKFDRKYTQDEYRVALLDSRIGINLAGAGFDTVRYWELPAHGCMLLSERLPIAIPHDFEDGVSAVFADDAGDMTEKLAYYIHHPEEAERIAQAGHAHFLRYHTSLARARQLLGWMQEIG